MAATAGAWPRDRRRPTSTMTRCCASAAAENSRNITGASCSARSSDHLAEKFGTKGSPISLSTACASGASAIQLGVEAIRRGEADAALCVATDGSVNPEALIRFSLLSALSTQNDPPQAAVRPFSKNRDGFVMAEGAGALVLESYEAATARGARILGVLAGCGELADSFHRTRSSPDGKPIIGCVRNALSDAGIVAGPDRLHQRARHRHAGKRQDGVSRHLDGVRRAHRAGFRSPPTSRWSATPCRRPARWKRCSRC